MNRNIRIVSKQHRRVTVMTIWQHCKIVLVIIIFLIIIIVIIIIVIDVDCNVCARVCMCSVLSGEVWRWRRRTTTPATTVASTQVGLWQTAVVELARKETALWLRRHHYLPRQQQQQSRQQPLAPCRSRVDKNPLVWFHILSLFFSLVVYTV